MHHRAAQLVRLIDRLDSPNATFLVHVSARTATAIYGDMRAAVGDRPNVHWLPRVAARYGGFSLLRASLGGIHAATRLDPVPDHLVQISGQDYPLRPPAELESILAERRGTSLVHHYALPAYDHWPGERGGLDRVERVYLERISYRTRLLRVPFVRRRLPAGLEPYGGSCWWTLSAEAVGYLDRFVRERPEVVRFFRLTKMPDELFVQTVLMNSPLRTSVANELLHYVDWREGGSHPAVLRTADVPKMLASGRLFARKFDTDVDGEALDVLDREALGISAGVRP